MADVELYLRKAAKAAKDAKDDEQSLITIVVGSERRVLTMGEWSKLIANPKHDPRGYLVASDAAS